MTWKSLLAATGVLLLSALTASAQQSYGFGSNLGQLNYSGYSTTNTCYILEGGEFYVPFSYTQYSFGSFVYVDSAQGINQSISGSFSGISGSPGSGPNSQCPDNYSSGSTINYSGTGYTITINGAGWLSAAIQVPGYVNPKYQVVGIIYAPPGSHSSVSYTNSNLVSSTISTKKSYTTGYTVGVATKLSKGIGAWKFGSLDSSVQSSTSWSQATTTTDTSAVTVQKQTSYQNGPFLGPTCDYCGVDHDYDIILVWLNPVHLFTLTNGGVVQPSGYGFSTLDQPGLDIYQVYAGELNGDFAMRSSTTTAFARAWASTTNFDYNTGSTPALTAQDEVNILTTDPFWDCTYKSPTTDGINCAKPADATFSGTVNTSGTTVTWATGSQFNQLLIQGTMVIKGVSYTVASVNSATSLTLTTTAGTQSGVSYSVPSRFTQSGNVNFAYTQPPPGGQPSTQAFTWTYTTTNSNGSTVSHDNKVEYGMEKTFKGTFFKLGFEVTLSKLWTMDHTYETSSQITTSNSSSATASITGPVCNNVNGACSPVYPPLNAYSPINCTKLSLPTAFGQGTTMYLYQDNLFGTFMFEPY